jgi:hypothetical protein
MNIMQKKKKISELLEDIKNIGNEDKVSLEAILNSNPDSCYFLMFIVTVFSILPLIFAIVFGTIGIFIVGQLLIGYKTIRLPKKLANLSINRKTLIATIDKITPTFKRLEVLTKNRFLFLFNDKVLFLLNVYVLLQLMILLIPIPFLNTIPTMSALFIVFGILNRDGLFVMIGIFVGCISYAAIFAILKILLRVLLVF